jgi:hypothetical protein
MTILTFFIVAMGDDSIEQEHLRGWGAFQEQLKIWGLRPDADFTGETTDIYSVNFCSHNFDVDAYGVVRANLRNWLKCLAKFLYLPRAKRSPEQIVGILTALRHAPEYPRVEQLFRVQYPELWDAAMNSEVISAPGAGPAW